MFKGIIIKFTNDTKVREKTVDKITKILMGYG